MRLLLGPLFYLRRAWLLAVMLLLAVVLLTLVTQVGGVVLWLSLPLLDQLWRRLRRHGRLPAGCATFGGFAVLYLAVSLALVPPVAGHFGRTHLPCFASDGVPLRAQGLFFCLANRHYARARVHRVLFGLAAAMAARYPGSQVAYLDAGFPFGRGFPLLPHLSHRGGLDVDIAFFWRDRESGAPIPPPSPFGYWAYAPARAGEATPCDPPGSLLRWDLDWLQPLFRHAEIDEARTAAMLKWLGRRAGRKGVAKILLEPHLKQRLAPGVSAVRFQGCRAARHDDHIHLRMRQEPVRVLVTGS